MMRFLCVVCLGLCLSSNVVLAAETTDEDIQAKTVNGDEVVLHPNGYWEFKDRAKAEVAKAKVAKSEQESGCPIGTRKSFLGIGRCIAFDDPVLKRGSLSGKGH
jgi:hypothetical protein